MLLCACILEAWGGADVAENLYLHFNIFLNFIINVSW